MTGATSRRNEMRALPASPFAVASPAFAATPRRATSAMSTMGRRPFMTGLPSRSTGHTSDAIAEFQGIFGEARTRPPARTRHRDQAHLAHPGTGGHLFGREH